MSQGHRKLIPRWSKALLSSIRVMKESGPQLILGLEDENHQKWAWIKLGMNENTEVNLGEKWRWVVVVMNSTFVSVLSTPAAWCTQTMSLRSQRIQLYPPGTPISHMVFPLLRSQLLQYHHSLNTNTTETRAWSLQARSWFQPNLIYSNKWLIRMTTGNAATHRTVFISLEFRDAVLSEGRGTPTRYSRGFWEVFGKGTIVPVILSQPGVSAKAWGCSTAAGRGDAWLFWGTI